MHTNTTEEISCKVLRLPFADRPPVQQPRLVGRHPKGVASLKQVRRQRYLAQEQQRREEEKKAQDPEHELVSAIYRARGYIIGAEKELREVARLRLQHYRKTGVTM